MPPFDIIGGQNYLTCLFVKGKPKTCDYIDVQHMHQILITFVIYLFNQLGLVNYSAVKKVMKNTIIDRKSRPFSHKKEAIMCCILIEDNSK